MNGHPGGEEHTLRLLELGGIRPPAHILDMGAGAGESVRLLNNMGYSALGIDLCPRGEGVSKGNMLHTPYPDGSFDGILCQCAFYVSGDIAGALRESARLLRKGGVLLFSDVCFTSPTEAANKYALKTVCSEDITQQWREYYLEAIWRGDAQCLPVKGKCSYKLMVFEKE